jgi:drug/metabolite transporter (DMT)-like permease
LVFHVVLLLYIACVWAFTFIFVKIEEQTVPPIIIMAGRALIAFFCLFMASIILKKDLRGHIKHIGIFIVFSILGIVGLWVVLSLGQEYIAAGLASVMVTAVPLLTFIILVFVMRTERFSLIGVGGLLMGALGIVLVISIKEILAGGSTLEGFLLIGSGFVMFAINGILVGKWAKGIDPVITTTYILGIGSAILLALSYIFESPLKFPLTKENIWSEIALGVICTASGYFGYYYLIHKAGTYFSSFIFYFIPVFGLIAGYLVLDEMVTMTQVLGVLLIFAGVYVINWEKFKKG